jgi:hypothetical protein
MTDYQPRVRLTLTQAEADAALSMLTSAEAGDLLDLLGDGRRVAAGKRALDRMRASITAAQDRTAAKAARKREGNCGQRTPERKD